MGKSCPLHIAELEAAADQGREAEVQSALTELSFASLPRKDRLPVAVLARRVGRPDLSVKALNAVVRAEEVLAEPVTAEEKSFYAAGLMRLGAVDEGAQLLEEIEPSVAPISILFHGHARVALWKYREAISYYERFVALPSLNSREKMLGKLNVAACHVHEGDYQAAEPWLKELLVECQPPLLGSVLEVEAQKWIGLREWERAKKSLDRAEQLLRSSTGLESMFVRKWRAILELRRTEGSDRSLRLLEDLRKEALEKRHWETLRDADLVEAQVTRNPHLFQRLFFGTPLEEFRQRIFSQSSVPIDLSETYDWKSEGSDKRVIDMQELRADRRISALHHRLLNALTSDFYRPFRIAALHRVVYPGQYYNPFTSPARIRQAVLLFRNRLKTLRLSLDVGCEQESFFIDRSKGPAIRVCKPGAAASEDSALKKLRVAVGETGEFSVKEAGKVLAFPPRTISRVLAQGVKDGTLVREGHGRSLSYRFARK